MEDTAGAWSRGSPRPEAEGLKAVRAEVSFSTSATGH